jgi:diaminopimelate dehydrogenase
MDKIKLGIIGFGNVGKAAAELAQEDVHFDLVGVFSRHMNDTEHRIFSFTEIDNFAEKIDVLLVCLGSQSDVQSLVPPLGAKFSTVDCFDAHALLPRYTESLRSAQACSKDKVSIIGVGWDPGLFSVIRAYMAMACTEPQTFWGRGVSLGHTNAIKQIKGVEDAIQFTVPNNDAMRLAKKGVHLAPHNKHKRVCHVVAPTNRHEEIKSQIINMPEYFAGYETEVHFLQSKDFRKRFRARTEHAGRIIAADNLSKQEFRFATQSNPYFTARVMLRFAQVCVRLSRERKGGVYTALDIPPSYLIDNYTELI